MTRSAHTAHLALTEEGEEAVLIREGHGFTSFDEAEIDAIMVELEIEEFELANSAPRLELRRLADEELPRLFTTACGQGLHRLCSGEGNAARRPFEEAPRPYRCECLCHADPGGSR